MAGSIKGIIVEIGGDTSGLQKALSKVNSQSSSLSKELKGINSLLKLDPKNTELLSQKQTVLNENIETTQEKLEQLKKIKEQITGYELINSTNKNISKRLSQIEKILDEPKTIKEFDKEIFDNLIEKIIIGEKDENENINPNTIRFI